MEKEHDGIELRSEKVRHIVGARPSWIIRNGTVIVTVVIVVIVLFVYVIYSNMRLFE